MKEFRFGQFKGRITVAEYESIEKKSNSTAIKEVTQTDSKNVSDNI